MECHTNRRVLSAPHPENGSGVGKMISRSSCVDYLTEEGIAVAVINRLRRNFFFLNTHIVDIATPWPFMEAERRTL